MYNSVSDLHRLELITDSFIGLEKIELSHSVRFKDFTTHYFNRFISNLTYSFKNFSKSDLNNYNSRHKRQLELVLSDPLLSLGELIVPIPKGMVNSYTYTIHQLKSTLDSVEPESLIKSLKALPGAVISNTLSGYNDKDYNRHWFEIDKANIIALYSKHGLTHNTAQFALSDIDYIKVANTKLLKIVDDNYPIVIELENVLKLVEKIHSEVDLSVVDQTTLKDHLMSLGYRLSIFAIVMEHIQDIEHNFIQCLDILRNHSQRS